MLNAFQDHVEYVFLGMVISGIFFIIDDDIKLFISRVQLRHSLRMEQMNVMKKGSIEHHIAHMLSIFPGKNVSASGFIRTTGMFAAVVFIVTVMSAGAPACFASAGMALTVPYGILRFRYEKLRSEVNDEREKMMSILLSAYRINNLNIEKAIEYTAGQTKDLPHTSVILSTMLLRLRECSNDADVRRVMDDLAKSIGNGWARSFAVNIRMAYVSGRNISVTLEEQLKQIRETRQLMQERLRSNSESVRMTTFMIPITLAVTAVMACGQMNMTPIEIVKVQFGDSTACMLLIVIIFLFMFNMAATQLVLRKKTDI